jgi:hypothetical protein
LTKIDEKSQEFNTWFKYLGNNIYERLKNLLSFLACSQIWLNLPVDHSHFGYITKLTPKETLPTGDYLLSQRRYLVQ